MHYKNIRTTAASSVTIFALIVGIFSVYNGRMTRKEFSRLIIEIKNDIKNLIVEESKLTRNMIKEITKEIKDLVVEESRLTRELIAKIGAKG